MQPESRLASLFRWACLATAALYGFLFVQLMWFPEAMLSDLGVVCTPGVCLVARRASMLMLGFAVLSALASRLAASPGRATISAAICVNMGGFAFMSGLEFARGALGSGILPIMAIETIVALAFAIATIADLRRLRRATP